MENENNKKKKNIVVIIVLVVIVLLFASLLLWKNFKNNKLSTVEYETKQLARFNEDFAKQMGYVKNSNMTDEESSYYLSNWINDNKSSYNSNSVDLASLKLINTLGGGFSIDLGLENTINSLLEGFDVSSLIGGILDKVSNNTTKKTITIKSNTVCQSVTDSKYCVDKLNAYVYITDVNSSKWAVLVHPFMTNGSLIYNAIGKMYEKQGYNIVAPDLRGFGNSDGSVAMGYLESLDIYDWIKDLNANYADTSRYGTSVAPDTIIVHGISLGGATTLQLATNPDIAAANGREPYTKNLTQLNVKGYVDDCGYTSMSGIVTDMLGGGNVDSLASLSTLFDSLGIKDVEYMNELQKLFEDYNISGFDFDFDSIISGTGSNNKPGNNSSSNKPGNNSMNDISGILDKFNVVKDFVQQYQYLEDALSGNMNNLGNNNLNNNWNNNWGGNWGNNSNNNSNNNTNNNSNNNTNNNSNNNSSDSSNNNWNNNWGGNWNNNSNNNGTSNNNTNPYFNGQFDLGDLNIDELIDKYGGSYQIPSVDEYSDYLDDMKDYWNKFTSGGNKLFQSNLNNNVLATPINIGGLLGDLNSNSGNLLDGIVGTAIMDLVGVGLTDDNYAKYSDVFSNGRKFPEGAKVVVIHGTADTTVPFSNADKVANNVSPATLVKKWEVSGAPHAFVIVGSKTTEYENLVANFTDCVENTSCKSIK